MIAEERIQQAQNKITKLLLEQCAHGAQQQGLPHDSAACGQFVGPTAKDRPQRGLHGTAAALRVLAQASDSQCCELVQRLVRYLGKRDELFRAGTESIAQQAFCDDQENVIKLSEVLYALSFVTPGQCKTEELKTHLAKKLLDARKEDKGWTYFLGQEGPPDILPTAFAVLALSTVGGYQQEISRQVEWLKESTVNEKFRKGADIIDNSVSILCLFALAYRQEELPKDELRLLRQSFKTQWKWHEAQFRQDLEQNIEYSRGATNYYVRIPWQLYLIALAARLHPRKFWSFTAQRRLEEILDAVLSGRGFRYPYSGACLSSRTNAVLFDTLEKIGPCTKGGGFRGFFYVVDRTRTGLSNPLVLWVSSAIGIGAVIFCIYSWVVKAGQPEDLGRSLTSSTLILAVSYFLEKLRKHR